VNGSPKCFRESGGRGGPRKVPGDSRKLNRDAAVVQREPPQIDSTHFLHLTTIGPVELLHDLSRYRLSPRLAYVDRRRTVDSHIYLIDVQLVADRLSGNLPFIFELLKWV
jgi:hypothetical protein